MNMRFTGRMALTVAAMLVLAFLLLPVAVIAAYAFADGGVQVWPIKQFSMGGFTLAFANPEIREAFALSLQVAVSATAIALLLSTMLALFIHRYQFPGRNFASFLVVMPLALPSVVTGIALNSYFSLINIPLSTLTLIIAHTTFCIVIVYNGVLARLKRLPNTFIEASADLGANSWRTFRLVTLPMIGSSLVSGALLAFALSFDEVIISTFTAGVQNTLPLWIFGAIRLGQHLNQVNAVVLVVIVITAVPVFLAQRLSGDAGTLHS